MKYQTGRKEMPSKIVGSPKLSMQLQMTPIAYADDTILVKLKQNNGWNVTNGSKRGQLEIMAEILLYCDQEQAKTNIMYKINLNYAQLKRYLKYLTSQSLLRRNLSKYVTTEKGYRFLILFAQLDDMLKNTDM